MNREDLERVKEDSGLLAVVFLIIAIAGICILLPWAVLGWASFIIGVMCVAYFLARRYDAVSELRHRDGDYD